MSKANKKDFNEYETIMKHKFDIEDRMAKIHNENTKYSQQLRLVEDQIRSMFNRFRIKLKEKKEENTTS